jgi:Zn-finger nucleic acid-binding protein
MKCPICEVALKIAGHRGFSISYCLFQSMKCPICEVALKIAGHRGFSISYCPLCGGTWLDSSGFDRLSAPAPMAPGTPKIPRRLLRIVLLRALILVGCLIATISVGAVKLWPTVRSWVAALVTGGESPMGAIRELATRAEEMRLIDLTRAGLDGAAASTLLTHSGFRPVLNAIAVAPDALPLIRNGKYLQVLEEAQRQNVQNLADIQTAQITSAEIRSAAEQIKQLIGSVPGAKAIGVVDPAVLDILRTDAFRQLSLSSFFDPIRKDAGSGERID